MTPDQTPTVRLVPLADLVEFARLVQSMRKAQAYYFGRQDPEKLRVAKDYEARVDARCRAIIHEWNQTPSLFGDVSIQEYPK